ncbi:Uncharacterised protein [Leminorella grimontii]|nr:Uncharacterised protein [Leminorella grimontii]
MANRSAFKPHRWDSLVYLGYTEPRMVTLRGVSTSLKCVVGPKDAA